MYQNGSLQIYCSVFCWVSEIGQMKTTGIGSEAIINHKKNHQPGDYPMRRQGALFRGSFYHIYVPQALVSGILTELVECFYDLPLQLWVFTGDAVHRNFGIKFFYRYERLRAVPCAGAWDMDIDQDGSY